MITYLFTIGKFISILFSIYKYFKMNTSNLKIIPNISWLLRFNKQLKEYLKKKYILHWENAALLLAVLFLIC